MNFGHAKRKTIVAILHNIRSLHNVGSIFRTADAVGISKIFLTGFSGTPDTLKAKKVSLGAEHSVPWEKVKDSAIVLKKLKNAGYHIVAVEQSKKSIQYNRLKARYPLALLMGHEVRGLSPALLEKADSIVEIPMRGKKESLNVSVAFGVVAYEYTK